MCLLVNILKTLFQLANFDISFLILVWTNEGTIYLLQVLEICDYFLPNIAPCMQSVGEW